MLTLDAAKPHAFFIEQEPSASGRLASVASIFLTNRRCPWSCVMCDLWKNTLPHDTPPGAIPAQIEYALNQLQSRPDPNGSEPTVVKLYNSGSFFDPRAIPPSDHPAIAERVRRFDRVIVECHPALVKDTAVRFRDMLGTETRLEAAMGLETVHPEVLPRLNKGMTLDQFATAAEFLRRHDIDLRAFILVKPPFMAEEEAVTWSTRSVAFARECHATAASIIPTRLGNEPLDRLAREGMFTPPELSTLEQALDDALALGRIRVFADLWDLERFSVCRACFPIRRDRLLSINLTQQPVPPARCEICG